MFFRSAKTVLISPRYDASGWLTAGTVRAVKQTVVSLKLHAMSMCNDTTVWMNARTVPAVNQTVVSGRGR